MLAAAVVQNVLGSVVKSKDTVRRVILTSSVAGAHHALLRALPYLVMLMTSLFTLLPTKIGRECAQ